MVLLRFDLDSVVANTLTWDGSGRRIDDRPEDPRAEDWTEEEFDGVELADGDVRLRSSDWVWCD